MPRVYELEPFREAAAALPTDRPAALAVTDFDRFKTYVHEVGKPAAVDVVKAFGKALATQLDKSAIIGHRGGDAFVVCLPDATPEAALIQLETLRTRFQSEHLVTPKLTLSVGIAARPAHGTSLEDLERAAMEAQQRAKREGGDRVALWVEEKMVLKSNYYGRGSLEQLNKLAGTTARTEASLLREALDDLFDKYRDEL